MQTQLDESLDPTQPRDRHVWKEYPNITPQIPFSSYGSLNRTSFQERFNWFVFHHAATDTFIRQVDKCDAELTSVTLHGG